VSTGPSSDFEKAVATCVDYLRRRSEVRELLEWVAPKPSKTPSGIPPLT
jgi:hypothetical protein